MANRVTDRPRAGLSFDYIAEFVNYANCFAHFVDGLVGRLAGWSLGRLFGCSGKFGSWVGGLRFAVSGQ